MAMIRDVTARNDADEALRKTDERLRFALKNAHVGIWDMDYTSGALQCSDVMETQFGLAPGTFGGTLDAFVECIHAEDRAAVVDEIEGAVKTGGVPGSGASRTAPARVGRDHNMSAWQALL